MEVARVHDVSIFWRRLYGRVESYSGQEELTVLPGLSWYLAPESAEGLQVMSWWIDWLILTHIGLDCIWLFG